MVRATAAKQSTGREIRWNFSDSRRATPLSLDEFLAGQDATKFFTGNQPWLVGIQKLSWQTFFRVCTEEMDDLSEKAMKLVIEYCLEILEEAEAKIQGKPSLARLEAVLNLHYAEEYENKAYQYQWALRHPVIREAVTRALNNRFPSR
jgi:hypothetical protein